MSSSNPTPLVIRVQQSRATLAIRATFNGEIQEYTVPARYRVCARLKTIYRLLNPWSSLLGEIHDCYIRVREAAGRQDIHALLTEVGQHLYAQVHPWLGPASEIEIVLDETCIEYPLDALYYQGKPLFLHKPVTYSLHPHSDTVLTVSERWKGLLISHRTSDPERAVPAVRTRFPGSIYYDDLDVRPDDLKNIPKADFVLISGHGGPKSGIDLEHIRIRPETLVQMAPRLVYLDSCRLGLHRGFLEDLHRSGTRYYLAPILNNESGESSTKTIERFFGALHDGESPSSALYLARKSLYEHYTSKGDDFDLVMIRAFPFRIYRLN